ncbi:MAG: hypothetical protein HY362_03995 [Candidatus Aenigmarchaeota archaeon]|nr:hypothetical protein [Candidatus Aenigmarchaeota archaeon]
MRGLLTSDPGFGTVSTPAKVMAYMPVNGVYPCYANVAYSFGFPKPRSISTLPADFWDTGFCETIREKTYARTVAPMEDGNELVIVAYGIGRLEEGLELSDGVNMGMHSAHLLYTKNTPRCWLDVYLRGRGYGVFQSPHRFLERDAFESAAKETGMRILKSQSRGFNPDLHHSI